MNNIYDLAGNLSEWTMENYNGSYRVNRGGYYSSSGSSYPASYRQTTAPNQAVNTIGVRQALYILNIPYNLSTTEPTQDDVTITLSTVSDHTIEYQIGKEGSWQPYTARRNKSRHKWSSICKTKRLYKSSSSNTKNRHNKYRPKHYQTNLK